MININPSELRVASPYVAQHATVSSKDATTSATLPATMGLKALAYKILQRNELCNINATSPKDKCNFPCEIASEKLHQSNISFEQVRAIVGDDWSEISNNPELLSEVSAAIQTQLMREKGIVPSHYIKDVICQSCGPVKLWEGSPDHVMGCPWCLLK